MSDLKGASEKWWAHLDAYPPKGGPMTSLRMRVPWWVWRPVCKIFGHSWGIRADFAAGEYCRCSRPLKMVLR